MAEDIKNHPVIKKLIAKKDAKRLSVFYMPLANTRELTIYWPIQDDKLKEQCLRYLEDYGCSDAKAKGQTWVDDPCADGVKYPGKWRIVHNRMSGRNEPPGIYQVLREGLLLALPDTEAADTEARLISDKVDPQNGKRVITRGWTGVDPRNEEDIITARLTVKSRTNITVRKQTFTGTFAVSDVYAQPMPDDGAVMVVEVLIELIAITSDADLKALTPLITQENEILDLFALKTGEGDYCTAVYTNINPSSREYLMVTMSDANLIADVVGGGATISGTWTYADRKFVEQKDNTAQFIVLLKAVVWAAWASVLASPHEMEYTDAGTERQGVRKYWYGVQKADLATAVTQLMSEVTVVPETAHHIRAIVATDNHNGSITLMRSEESKYDNIANTNGTLIGSRPITPFALQSGTVARLMSIYDGFTEAEIEAVSDPLPSGYTLVDSKTEPSGGYFKATFEYEKRTWLAWGHNAYAADKTEYGNAGTANEKEVINKTWYGIQKSDLSTAISNARLGTSVTPESGYIITDAGVHDNQDGSITITQSQKKQVNAVDVGVAASAGKEMHDPHGPFTEEKSAYTEYINTHYEHFTAAGLATAIASETAPAGYILKSITPSLAGDGLHNQVYHYEKPYFANTAGTRNLVGITNAKTDGSTGAGLDVKTYEEGHAIPAASLVTVRDAATVTDANHVLDRIHVRNNKDGSGSIFVEQTQLNAITTQYAHRYNPAVGRREASLTLLWKNISAVNKVLLYNDAVANGAAMSAATYQPAPASHVLRDIICQDNGNNSWNVLRTTYIPLYSAGSDWDGGVSQRFYEEFTVPKFRISGGTKQVRKFRFHVFTLQTKSKGSADSWLTSSHNYTPIVGAAIDSTTPVKTHLIFAGKNRYRSICTFGSCTAWLDEPAGAASAYRDLGVAAAT